MVVVPSAAAAGHTVITNVRTIASFDYAADESPENIHLNPDGSMTISMLGSQGKERST